MNTPHQNPAGMTTAVITVSVESDAAQRIASVVQEMLSNVVVAHYEGYISAQRRPHFESEVRDARVCIAIVDFDQDSAQALEAARYVQQQLAGQVILVALSMSQNPDLLIQAMRSGCSEFLGKPFNDQALAEMLQRLHAQWTEKDSRTESLGSVLSFFGVKGGVGCTTLAVHLATYLAQVHNKKTLLIDNHPELGHVCVYLGIDGSNHQFHDLVRNVRRLDSDLLRGYVATHSTGLDILASPDKCGDAIDIDPESVSKTLQFLRREYDYIVVDSKPSLDELTRSVIERASQIILVVAPEVGAVRDLSRYVDSLTQLDQPAKKIQVVLNRFSSRYAVNAEQIEKAIRIPIAVKLPNGYTELVRAVNLGLPVSPNSKSDLAAQFMKWSTNLVSTGRNAESSGPAKPLFALWK